MKPSTRKLLEEAIIWGKRNSGHGYSMSRKIEEILRNEDDIEVGLNTICENISTSSKK